MMQSLTVNQEEEKKGGSRFIYILSLPGPGKEVFEKHPDCVDFKPVQSLRICHPKTNIFQHECPELWSLG
jgi:hypothetical protein